MSVFPDNNLPPSDSRILQDLWQAPDQSAFENLLKKLDINRVLDRISTNPEHLSVPQLEELESRLMKYSEHPGNTSLKERVTATFEKNLGPLPDHALIQEVRSKFPESSEREVKLIARAIQGVEDPEARTEIFDVIRLSPSEEREEIIALALPRIKGIKDGNDRAFILSGIEAIPKDDRKSALDAIVSLFTGSGSGTMETMYMNNHRILTYFRVIPKDKRAEFLNKIGFFLAEFSRASKGSLLNHIKEIPLADLEDAIHLIGAQIKVIKSGAEIGEILREIAKIPAGDREDVVKKVVSLVKVGQDSQNIASVFIAIDSIPAGERAEVMDLVKPKIQDMDDNLYISCLLRGIGAIPSKDRASITDTIVDLFSGSDISDVVSILFEIFAIPEKERAASLTQAVPLVKAVGANRAWILKMIPFFSPGSLADITKFLSENRSKIKKDWPQTLQWIFEENPALAEQTRSYLLTQLQSLMDPKEVRSLAQEIYSHPEAFQVHEEHELFQEVISKLALTDNTNDPKNPYRLFMLHKQRASEPLPSVKTPSEVIDGKTFSLNPQGFQENAIAAVPITFAQLPKSVGPDDVTKLFAALASRLAQMNEQEKTAAEQYITSTTEGSFYSLQTNFAGDAYLNSLLAIPRGKPEETVPADAARFFAIVSFISSQSNSVEPGQLLSPQEEVLLKMSASIQACKKGKSEGIAIAYNTLDPKFRYDKVQAGGENAKAYLATVVQEELNNTLSADNPIMRELRGSLGPISQLAHQTIYLRNFIGRAIGLPHPLEFDPYTGVLSNELIERDLKDTLEIFYKHITPKMLAAALKKQVDRELYKDKTEANPAGTFDAAFFGKLNAFLGNALGNWDMDEDEMEVEGLSEKGALDLLVRAGYLKQA